MAGKARPGVWPFSCAPKTGRSEAVPPSGKARFQPAKSSASSTLELQKGRVSPALLEALGQTPGPSFGRLGRVLPASVGQEAYTTDSNASARTDLFGCVCIGRGPEAKPEKLAPSGLLKGGEARRWVPVRRASGLPVLGAQEIGQTPGPSFARPDRLEAYRTGGLAISTANTWIGPSIFERNTIHFMSGEKVTFGSSR